MSENGFSLFHIPEAIESFFKPSSIAVIGATEAEHSVGKTLTLNLLNSSFKGKIFLINKKRDSIFNNRCYPSVSDVPGAIDLAVIATPAKTIPDIVRECGEKGIKAAIVISAGFKETGEQGMALEKKVLEIAEEYAMRIIGPNCLGLMNPHWELNASFSAGMPKKGSLAFLSQSGALCTAVLDWSFQEEVGFSAFVSLGSMADVSWADLINYIGNDPQTKCILLYMETIGDARSFIAAAKRVAPRKPIIVIKGGKTQESAQAAASHTGSLAGSDAIFDVAMERSGVLRIATLAEFFNVAKALASQSLPEGPNVTMITNAGGPSVLATDSVVLSGAKMAKLPSGTLEKLNTFLPEAWSHGNPVDILGDAGPDRYEKTFENVVGDKDSNGILIILTPQDMTDATGTAKALIAHAHTPHKTLFASWMGGPFVQEGVRLLNSHGIPQFSFPDDAGTTFGRLWELKQRIDKTTREEEEGDSYKVGVDVKAADSLLRAVIKDKRNLLAEGESKDFLEMWGIPIVKTHIAHNPLEAVRWAEKIGFPVVLKLYSHTITHKTDVGGVKLNLKDKESVIKAFEEIEKSVLKTHKKEDFLGVTVQKMITDRGYEMILGSSTDPQFGPVILVGSGGELVEVYRDAALGFPPLSEKQAEEMLEKTKIYQAAKGVRGKKAIDLKELHRVVQRFSYMLLKNPRIKECDINPLLASPQGIIALDARILLHDPEIHDVHLPHAAIRLYPEEWVQEIRLKKGTEVIVRPAKKSDLLRLKRFALSLGSKKGELSDAFLEQFCQGDYESIIPLIGFKKGDLENAICFATLHRIQNEAELKIAVAPEYQHQLLGKQLLNHLIAICRMEGIKNLFARYGTDNTAIHQVLVSLGFIPVEQKRKDLVVVNLRLI
jgi:acetyltransferase